MNTPFQPDATFARLSPVTRLRHVLLAGLVTLIERLLNPGEQASQLALPEEEWTLEEWTSGCLGSSFIRVFHGFR
ncbi:hypothetical protein [Deinococcus yavapaiensis]|uniref:Uncharacterized protein n=1 Tax=Deinococcus yavapaiensis KR-236 TaxID=694435 RepID=A0A318S084_9DEIO|nr:hypothetical protein [Deinococcus yavapaiensis]PYE50405.1 hypothetical protein DES52_11822 [Deinococcus yavapaiensis KR-236]